MFGKTEYELPLARNYVAHWKMANAVRELIQNALDSESPFKYEFSGDMLRLTSEFTTLGPNTLLLGTTSKAESKESIGSFGEGYKIAMLVLTREGNDVEFHNGPVRWTPSFHHSKKFQDEVLVVTEESLPAPHTGLDVYVRGLTDEDISTIRSSCLLMQSEVGEVKKTSLGDVLLNRPGQLFVGGLFITQTGLKYGYNIKPEYVRLERDRKTVDNWELKSVTLNMLIEAFSYKEVSKLIIDGVSDVEYARWNMPAVVEGEIYRQWSENNKNTLVAETQEELKSLVAQGFKVVHVSGSVYRAVTSSPAYKEAAPKMRATYEPADMLRQWFAKHHDCLNGDAAKDWAQIILTAKDWRCK